MKVGDWWVQQGLLTTMVDPSRDLEAAADQFPSEYVPMVFMTGDGHRNPPFQWTSRGHWADIFAEIVNDNKLCCHVETYADAVNNRSVPNNLLGAFQNNKVFGWEPDFYKTLQKVLEEVNDIRPDVAMGIAQSKAAIRSITSGMWRVHDMGYMQNEGRAAMNHWDTARRLAPDPVPITSLPGFANFLRDYERNAMLLRVQINNVIGRNIQRKIDEYPDHVHLITCGDAHIIRNPLYNFIRPPVGTFGIADQNRE